MSEGSKYENLLNELSSIEAQASVVKNKYKDTFKRNRELQEQLVVLKKENNELLQKFLKIEDEYKKNRDEKENNIINSLNLKERESLKIKLQDLLSKIEYHLSAEKQT